MRYEQYIARKYLISRHSYGLVSVLSAISVVGVTIGVAALIVVLSVFNGFQELVTGILVNFDPHLRIERTVRSDTADYDIVRSAMNGESTIQGIAPFSSGKALIVARGLNRVINVRGMDPELINAVSGRRSCLGVWISPDRSPMALLLEWCWRTDWAWSPGTRSPW
jgi:lipoprotein-releasing system permease protein